ncbi:hypothetical protein LRR81_04380 [Metabacillus sp. GX 13764]|nr:hypothetical protein [Metabacillus kandeliae]MCD7033457.1 hypothetical protein [Metabacillus kandeliae]
MKEKYQQLSSEEWEEYFSNTSRIEFLVIDGLITAGLIAAFVFVGHF